MTKYYFLVLKEFWFTVIHIQARILFSLLFNSKISNWFKLCYETLWITLVISTYTRHWFHTLWAILHVKNKWGTLSSPLLHITHKLDVIKIPFPVKSLLVSTLFKRTFHANCWDKGKSFDLPEIVEDFIVLIYNCTTK